MTNFPPNVPLRGITTDIDGNVYISLSGRTANNYVLKYSPYPNFTYLGQSATDDVEDNNGWSKMMGIVYSETSNLLYTSSYSNNEDCISVFDLNLNSVPALKVPNPNPGSSQNSKGIAITKECCPTKNLVFNETVCSNGQGERFFLQELFSCGDGVVTEGQWTVSSPNPNQIFNSCDLSITVNGSGCATYVLEKTTNKTGNQQCNQFRIEVTICTEVPSATLSTLQSTCSGSTPNNDGKITLTAISNADKFGISTGATYTGADYASATAIGTLPQDLQTGIPNAGETYTIRFFQWGGWVF